MHNDLDKREPTNQSISLRRHAHTIINQTGSTRLGITMALAVTIAMEHRDVSDDVQPIIKPTVPERENRKRKVRTEENKDNDTYEDSRTNTTDFNLNGPTEVEHENDVNLVEEDVQPTNLAAELLRMHHHIAHAPFAKIQEMVKQGALPRRLAKLPNTNMHGMPVRKSRQEAMEGKADKRQGAKRRNLSRPEEFFDARIGSAKQRNSHNGKIQMCDRIH
jgi:hypothetical protein